MTDLDECAKRVGTTVRDKWKLERLLGVGGMAAVYVAVHKIGRRDAIKILHAEVARSPEVRARFEQEAQAVNRFKHPGAVEIRDIDVTEQGEPFLVMELLEGETLSRIVRREPGPSIDDVLRWTDELLDVLVAAHAQGIIHRDVKPDNLFVQKDGRLKVLDFGIARVRSGAAMSMKTATGATIGTVSYMPPEQAKGGDIDARADVFAVGATMFRLIARRKIHEAENDIELLKKVATTPAPRLATVAPSVPEAVARIVDRALEFDRDARYPDAASMQADVRAVRSATPSSLASSVPAIPVDAASPLAASVETPASVRTVPPNPPDRSEAPTVGRPSALATAEPARPQAPAEATAMSQGVASSQPTRPDTTLQSGPRSSGTPQLVTVPLAPIARPPSAQVSAPPAPPVSASPGAIASAPPAPRDRWKLPLLVGGAIAAFVLVVIIGVLAATVWLVKSTPRDDSDAATSDAADPLGGASADDAAAPTTSSPTATATHKATVAPKPTAPAPAPAPQPTHPHPTPHGGH